MVELVVSAIVIIVIMIIGYKYLLYKVRQEETRSKEAINSIFDEANKKMNFKKVSFISAVIGFFTSFFTGNNHNDNEQDNS